MKVFVPVVDSSSHRYEIAGGFRASGSVCIFDTKDDHVTWYDANGVSLDYAELLNELKTNGVVHVITSTIQPMALKVFTSSGFTVYRSVGTDLLVNLELLKVRCLPLYGFEEALSETTGCLTSCSSCESAMCKN
jgi:predicted Fe-Mo cluster-binding NifX family protein